MLVVTIACLTFGVLALTTADFTVAGTVTFNNYNCDCALDVKVLGLSPNVTEVTQDSATKRYYKEFKFTTKERTGYTLIENNGTMQLNELTFDELNTEIEDKFRSEITISITLHNYSTYPVQLSSELGTNIPTGLTVTLSDLISAEASTDGTTATDATNNFTITLKATGENAIAKEVNFATVSIEPYDPYKIYKDQGYEIAKLSDFDTDGASLTKYNGSATKLYIPKFDDYSTLQNNNEFFNEGIFSRTTIKDVVIEYGYTTIGESAFDGCGYLTSVIIPSSVTSIGDGAFQACSILSSITIPSSVVSIGYGAFENCIGLNSVSFENATGWKVDKSSTGSYATNAGVTDDASNNATLLRSTYLRYYWKRV